ncbi:MAG: ABC transporter substrate-binding protein, partial [Actinobacteria bacterium]|nr:ABC transporter substrate-binding protein [Actinomycetota bacterium]
IPTLFVDMWDKVPTNKVVATLYPNDADGNAWGDPEKGFPPILAKAGYTVVDGGRYQDGTEDFSSIIAKFKAANAEILTGVPLPADFVNFWKQASQQGYHPKVATVGKALQWPSQIEAMGDIGTGLSSEMSWAPTYPFKSSLTGDSAQQLADKWTAQKNKEWLQTIGHSHALIEVAIDALKRTTNVDDKEAIVKAIEATNLDTIVGNINFSGGPVPHVAKTAIVGGQWTVTDGKAQIHIVSSPIDTSIPLGGEMVPISW